MKVNKEKQIQTVQKMKETRKIDSIHLRTIIDDKIKNQSKERQDKLQIISELEKQINTLKIDILKLNGSLETLVEILSESAKHADASSENSNEV